MPEKKNNFYSIIIPVYKEESNIKQLFLKINQIMTQLEEQYEFIVVDDGSPDQTWNVIKELSEHYSQIIKALRFSRNFGKESALCAGFNIAKGDAVVIMDGDLQHPPELIPHMLQLWKTCNFDIIEAVKVSRGSESLIHKMGARLFYAILHYLSGYNLKDQSDYKLLDRKVVNALLTLEERNLFFRGMSAWLGFRRISVPFEVPSRVAGYSTWSNIKLARLAMDGITSFSSLPLHLVTILGVLFLAFSIILTLQTLLLKFSGQALDGFTTIIILLIVIGSILMVSLGIIGIYIAKIYEEVKSRPRYIISDKLGSFNE